jgi:hypothetical protein
MARHDRLRLGHALWAELSRVLDGDRVRLA